MFLFLGHRLCLYWSIQQSTWLLDIDRCKSASIELWLSTSCMLTSLFISCFLQSEELLPLFFLFIVWFIKRHRFILQYAFFCWNNHWQVERIGDLCNDNADSRHPGDERGLKFLYKSEKELQVLQWRASSASRVHLIHPCCRQLYLAKEMHFHPHYSISPNDLALFRQHCAAVLEDESSVQEYSATASHESNDIHCEGVESWYS